MAFAGPRPLDIYGGPGAPRAASADLTLAISGNDFVLTLRDHGRGFAPGEQHGTSHGTKNIGARAEALGGHATIGGEPGRGTTVTVSIPLSPGPRC